MGCTISEWTATASDDGDTRTVRVAGSGECTQSGYRLRLEPTNEGVVDDPEVAALRLIVEAPEHGADVMTPVEVEFEIRGDPAVRIRIDTPDGSEWVSVDEA
jgi:hypothetical protein